jgi:hypothetical protein
LTPKRCWMAIDDTPTETTSQQTCYAASDSVATMRFASPFKPCLILFATSCHSFNPASFAERQITPVRVFQSATEPEINGEEGGGRSGIVRLQDTTSQLFAAFTALGEGDQYDAVLTGLCAKFLETASPSPESQIALQDPLDLLQEMNRRRIQASPRSIMALIDVCMDVLCDSEYPLKFVVSIKRVSILFHSQQLALKALKRWPKSWTCARRTGRSTRTVA